MVHFNALFLSFSVISENITINHILPKTILWATFFCHKEYRSGFNHFDVIGPEAAEFGEITQNNGHYAIRGHSRSPFSNNRKPVCHFLLMYNLTSYLVPFPSYCALLVKLSLSTGGCLTVCLTHTFVVNPSIRDYEIWPQKN